MPPWVRLTGIAAIIVALGILIARIFLYPEEHLQLPATEILVGNHAVVADPDRCGVNPTPSFCFFTVARFGGDAHGNVAPTSSIYTNFVTAVALDGQGNIYVASDIGNQVLVYSPATVDSSPPHLRNIQGPSTKLVFPTGLALDRQGNLYVAVRGGPNDPSAVLKFAPGADGDATPIAIIPSILPKPGVTPAVNTHLQEAGGVAVDFRGSIYVVDSSFSQLLIFAPGAIGYSDVAPAVRITTGLHQPQQVALGGDLSIYVTNRGADPSVAVYAPTPVADVATARTITSADLRAPFGIAVDGTDKIFVADADPQSQSVLVFDTGASGNVTPLRKIQGDTTGLNNPLGIAVHW
jgi:hypothetical protein